MSSDPSSSQPASPTPTTKQKPWLFVLLVVMIACLAYDRLIARPASVAAYNSVDGLVHKSTSQSVTAEPITNDSVQQTLGKAPSAREDTDAYSIETYCWRRGLPVLTYDLHVVYRPNPEGKLIVYAPFLNEEPAAESLPGYVVPVDRTALSAAKPTAGSTPPGGETAVPEATDPETTDSEITVSETTVSETTDSDTANAELNQTDNSDAETTESETSDSETTDSTTPE